MNIIKNIDENFNKRYQQGEINKISYKKIIEETTIKLYIIFKISSNNIQNSEIYLQMNVFKIKENYYILFSNLCLFYI